MRTRILLASACVVAGLTACAGFRGGWESYAYIGDPPNPQPLESRSPYESNHRPPLTAPGLSLRVSIDNRLREYDRQVWMFAIPVSVDPRDVQSDVVAEGRTRVRLAVSPTQPGFVFRPQHAVLTVGHRSLPGAAGFVFTRVPAGSGAGEQRATWEHRPIDGALHLTVAQEAYLLSIDFELPSPSPESTEITLDLSQALQAPGIDPIPPIRFLPVRWKEAYS